MSTKTSGKILVIDDDPTIRMSVSYYLQKMGYDIVTAASGEEGIELAVSEQPDLILLDLMMPGKNGFETCEILKTQHSTNEIPVIFLTSMSERDYILKCFKSGCVDYLRKPFEFAELYARISTHIRLKIQREILIQNSRIMEKELELAAKFQKNLLPVSFPPIASVKSAARFIPALKVAGDFYDFIDLGNEKVGFIIADVSGHGVMAALIAAMLKIDFLNFAHRENTPAEVLNEVNLHLEQVLLDESFCTAFYGILDTRSYQLNYASAGHLAPLYYTKENQAVYELPQEGFPLGIMIEADYKNFNLQLNGGDKLILYTDGIIEATNEAGEFFTVEKLISCFEKNAHLSVEELESAVYKEILEFTQDSSFKDDLTLLILEFLE
ncbi:MAG: PP2C family protein-serine/threonine phosphatase [Vulcanimicrobiota bacterium]